MGKFQNLVGQRFNKLLVKSLVATEKRGSIFLCSCECGRNITAWAYNIKNGHTTSCGCARADALRKTATKHGMYGDRFYNIYRQIIRRCTEPKHKAFKNYGGRGIKNLWESFEEFKQDMYESYKIHCELFGKANTTIDRIDNNFHYTLSNCKWSTWEEQASNKRFPPKTVSIKRNTRKADCPFCRVSSGISHKLECKEVERLKLGKRVRKYSISEVVV